MSVKQIIIQRRAYRSLDPIPISTELLKDLAECAQLAPSCFNKQPWRFVFVTDKPQLEKMYQALSAGNEWARRSNLIVAVISGRELDCVIGAREYFLFDTGMANAFLMLRATELGLVAHPIAGFDEARVKEILAIPSELQVIALVIIGARAEKINPELSPRQIASEKQRPERLPLESLAFLTNSNHQRVIRRCYD